MVRKDSTYTPHRVESVLPLKRKRLTQACMGCRRKKIKCDGHRPHCYTCLNANMECEYSTECKKRGPKRGYIVGSEKRTADTQKAVTPDKDDVDKRRRGRPRKSTIHAYRPMTPSSTEHEDNDDDDCVSSPTSDASYRPSSPFPSDPLSPMSILSHFSSSPVQSSPLQVLASPFDGSSFTPSPGQSYVTEISNPLDSDSIFPDLSASPTSSLSSSYSSYSSYLDFAPSPITQEDPLTVLLFGGETQKQEDMNLIAPLDFTTGFYNPMVFEMDTGLFSNQVGPLYGY